MGISSFMNIDKYFERIGFTGTPSPTLGFLQDIHHLHPLAIAFENITAFTGAPVSLEPEAVFEKLVTQGRGGYCFEHNLLLATVLRETGFEVSTHAARVIWQGIDKSQAPRTHMLLKVTIDGNDWIADVGFGGLTMTAALQLESDAEQSSPHESFRITRDGDHWLLAARLGDAWKAMYVFDLSHQQPVDFALSNYFVATHPESLFVQNLIMARPYRNGRHAFLNTTWMKYSRDGNKTEKVLTDPAEILTLMEEIFKIRLEESVDPQILQARLADLIARQQETQ
jgi:N-hydroxyarylamine O-acetyltransferase